MMKPENTTPLQRHALLAALGAPDHRFNRTRAGYVPAGATSAPAFTFRLMRMLEAGYLVTFDSTEFPTSATLTLQGVCLAETLRAIAEAKSTRRQTAGGVR
ncbi:hypothetical protein [Pseudoxanthomonas indica]|uniref:Uncharacterized protein n=1 Tax=Pseudoxanthomonas indica TaxID=428993 RepID=A0A1T5K1E6_9GAMM|nr:hypothetical protein [Pseudoxanthomonas indica]GGD45897.1 hypothetical protein GCM10007235_17350 [Pseudoxanthomonas indica]SKC57471.1 hypothetical protein SAMN06296058_1273 [Pseudoxanthomonas indica]